MAILTAATPTKVVGITLITSTNMPLGRDGPMVHIGAPLQRSSNSSVHTPLTHLPPRPLRPPNRSTRPPAHPSSAGAMCAALLTRANIPGTAKLLELRLPGPQREWVAVGAVAGVAAAFNAPIGGILYSFEEVSFLWSSNPEP